MDFPRTSDPEAGWDAYSRYWEEHVRSERVSVLGEEWFSPEEVGAIWRRFGAPYVTGATEALEIGCGGGKWSRLIAEASRRLVAADISREMLERTRALVPRVELLKLNGVDLEPLPDASFHFVWSFDVFLHLDIEDVWGYLGEIRRVLRPAGVAVIHLADLLSPEGFAQFVREAPQSRGSEKVFSRLRWLSDAMARRLVGGAGFRIVDGNVGAAGKELARRDLIYVLAVEARPEAR